MKKILSMLLLTFCTVQGTFAADVVIIGSDGQARYENSFYNKSEKKEIDTPQKTKEQSLMNNKILQLSDFDETILIWKSLYKVKKNNKWGIYNNYTNKFIINLEYDNIEQINGDWFKVAKHGKYGLYNYRDKILNTLYDEIIYKGYYKEQDKNLFNPAAYGEDHCYMIFVIRQNNKYAFETYSMYEEETLHTPIFDYENIVEISSKEYKIAKNKKNALWTVEKYTKQSGFKSKFLYDDIIYYNHDLYIVVINSKKGLYDKNKKQEITKIIYDDFKIEEGAYNAITGSWQYKILGKVGNKWEVVHSYSYYMPKKHNPYL